MRTLARIYREVVHWQPNIFTVPLGATGKKFVDEVIRFVIAFAESNAPESVAFLSLMTMPHLLLQKPVQSASHRQKVDCLQRRLQIWIDGRFDELLEEGKVIQHRLCRRPTHPGGDTDNGNEDSSSARTFGRMMKQGKVKAALRLLSGSRSSVLDLDDALTTTPSQCTVREVLKQKHPPPQPAETDVLLQDTPPLTHDFIFENLDCPAIRSVVFHSQGGEGPSGMDAASWKRMCTKYHGTSNRLCSAIAALVKRLATTYIDPAILKPFIACRLIPLTKKPVRSSPHWHL